MEELGGRGQIDDLHVALCAQKKEALEACARMLRTLTLEAVRQEHHEPAQAVPFVFGRRDELVDDDLRDVDEVAELRFPTNECIRRIERVAPLEAEHSDLG